MIGLGVVGCPTMFFPAISPHDSISAEIPYLPPHGWTAYFANCSLLRVGGAILSILERFKKKKQDMYTIVVKTTNICAKSM